jgi:hypothetical protein
VRPAGGRCAGRWCCLSLTGRRDWCDWCHWCDKCDWCGQCVGRAPSPPP